MASLFFDTVAVITVNTFIQTFIRNDLNQINNSTSEPSAIGLAHC